MSKPIFEPGDFKFHRWTIISSSSERALVVAQEMAARDANLKLSFLGIDAETPEKLKQLEAEVERWKTKEVERAICCVENEDRIKELEQALIKALGEKLSND